MSNSKYLEMLAKEYPNHRAVKSEIINLKAILALPKGTEYFLSDLHGEYDAFQYMVRSASGIIKKKIDEKYGNVLNDEDRDELAALIYSPKAEIARKQAQTEDFDDWCATSIYRLVNICRSVSSKYTRSKVRKALPENSGYIIDELLYADKDENRAFYYKEIINSILEYKAGATFLRELAEAISNLAVDQLHIVGDIYDRGPHPEKIMDLLMNRHDVDIQWGNHDIVWMGAAMGNWPCIANIIRMNVSYNNFDMLEVGYGINLRPLATYAEKIYGDDECEAFRPHLLDRNRFDPIDETLAAKMHKMIAICQFKVEGKTIKHRPEYEMDCRLLLDKIDFNEGTVNIEGQIYKLKDVNLPTIDPKDPYKLTKEEEEIMNALEASILNSKTLQEHLRFLFSHGALYKKVNGNLLYHGCIPMTEDGEFEPVTINGETHAGADLMTFLDEQVRKAYFVPPNQEKRAAAADLLWYLWKGKQSPLFGKDKMTTFERLFIGDENSHIETTRPYYKLINSKESCIKIIRDFGLDPSKGKIINGHIPVKTKDGESPVKGGGMLYIIDGGISKAYQKRTGIAGYTFIYNSRFMSLAEHKNYSKIREDGTQEFNHPTMHIVDTKTERMLIIDTDIGKELINQINDLTQLIKVYEKGILKEKYPPKKKWTCK